MLNVKLSTLMDEQNNSTDNNNNSNGKINASKQGGGGAAANTASGYEEEGVAVYAASGQEIVELIERLMSQIQENDERLRELNTERNTIHRSLRECRQQLDGVMEQYRLEVIVKNGKEYRPKQKYLKQGDTACPPEPPRRAD